MQCHFSLSPHFPTCEQGSTTIAPSKARWSVVRRAGPSTGHVSAPLCPACPSISRSCQLDFQGLVSLISPHASPAPHPAPGSLFQFLNWPPRLYFTSLQRILLRNLSQGAPFLCSEPPSRTHCTRIETQGPRGHQDPTALLPVTPDSPLTPGPLHLPRPLPGTLPAYIATSWLPHLLQAYPRGLPRPPCTKYCPSMPLALLYWSHITHQPTYYVRVPLPTLDVLISLLRVRVQLCPQQHPPGLHQARHWVNARFGLDSNSGI